MWLRWENVGLEGRTLMIPTTKNGIPPGLPLSSFLLNLFKELWRRFPDDERGFSALMRGSDFRFYIRTCGVMPAQAPNDGAPFNSSKWRTP